MINENFWGEFRKYQVIHLSKDSTFDWQILNKKLLCLRKFSSLLLYYNVTEWTIVSRNLCALPDLYSPLHTSSLLAQCPVDSMVWEITRGSTSNRSLRWGRLKYAWQDAEWIVRWICNDRLCIQTNSYQPELRENRSIRNVHPGNYWGSMVKDHESTGWQLLEKISWFG